MDYLNFTLVFCAIMMLFAFGWVPIAYIFIQLNNINAKNWKSMKLLYTIMFTNKVLNCFFMTTITILLINKYQIVNSSIAFLVYMITITTIFFLFFFADSRLTEEKTLKLKNHLSSPEYLKGKNINVTIEMIFVALFIPIVFFPNLIDNILTSFIFDKLYYVATIKILGVLIGIFGLFSLIKYIKIIGMAVFLTPWMVKNIK